MLFVCALALSCFVAIEAHSVEARGKKKKIALLIYFADLILKKVFIFKLVYAFIFWVVVHKAGYFLAWFISYLKQQKHEHVPHHEYIPHHEYGHHEYGPHHDYGPYNRRQGGRHRRGYKA
ncbi:uncharacterized protein LOC121730725 [Aricia agestis]|uniref:uncharacterized protein LOC121730725 n=1 Tax=Aricia agestis TaxID=91739 RepID=UPI001C2085FC|nr:uncharacterized protein LOC121730725 [Aricia agestis]